MAMPLSFACKVDMLHTVTEAARTKGRGGSTHSGTSSGTKGGSCPVTLRSHQAMETLVKQAVQV